MPFIGKVSPTSVSQVPSCLPARGYILPLRGIVNTFQLTARYQRHSQYISIDSQVSPFCPKYMINMSKMRCQEMNALLVNYVHL